MHSTAPLFNRCVMSNWRRKCSRFISPFYESRIRKVFVFRDNVTCIWLERFFIFILYNVEDEIGMYSSGMFYLLYGNYLVSLKSKLRIVIVWEYNNNNTLLQSTINTHIIYISIWRKLEVMVTTSCCYVQQSFQPKYKKITSQK